MKTTARLPFLAPCLALSLWACALDAGDPFATVEPSLEAALEVHEDELTADGYLKLASGYEVRFDAAALTVDEIRLIAGVAGSDVAVFDPANPPDGYSLCHGGHCHAEDGSLVDYATIEAELSGGAAPELTTALTLTFDGPLDLLAPAPIVPGCSSAAGLDGCGLGAVSLKRVELAASRLVIQGQVRDGQSPPRIEPRAFAIDLALPADGAGLFVHALDFTAERHGEETFALTMHLVLSGELLGEVDWTTETFDEAELLHEVSESSFAVGAGEVSHEGHDHDHDHDHDHGAEVT